VGLYLFKVLLLSSLSLGPLLIKGGNDLGEGFFRYARLLLPHGEASSVRMSSPSLAMSSSTTIADGAATAGPEDKEGGSGMHKAYEDKSATHQVNISTYYEGWPKPYLVEACIQ
jgi:hypothetical protein